MGVPDKDDVYRNLASSPPNKSAKNKWTCNLIFCCITACLASFQFGYNIGSTNLPTPLIKDFYTKIYRPGYYYDNLNLTSKNQTLNKKKELLSKIALKDDPDHQQNLKLFMDYFNTTTISSNLMDYNTTLIVENENLNKTKINLEPKQNETEKFIKLLWTITVALFVIGGMIGALTSKYVLDYIGRKNGILFHYLFTIVGSILAFISPLISSPECLMVSRFLFGIQGGMACGLVPTYLSEIAPTNLRGATGVIHQLNLTIGILVAQFFGFRQLLGTSSLWHVLLAIPIIPAVFGGLILAIFFYESPRALLIKDKNEDKARRALEKLRNTKNVSDEIQQICQEARDTTSNEAISLKQLFLIKELRWPLFTGLLLQIAQQLCGINAGIFRGAQIVSEQIQYAVVLTGIINVILTIVCVPLVDRLGRKPLLVYPMMLMIVDFILLTVFLNLQSKASNESTVYPYLSIVCIIVFIMCFAIGLGPIPFIYVAECFRQDARSAALAICMFVNWLANLFLTLTFPYLADFFTTYVFVIFAVIVAITVSVIIKKVPETKERNVEEIMEEFNGSSKSFYERSDHMLMSNRS